MRTLPEWAQLAMTFIALVCMMLAGAPLWAYPLPVLMFLLSACDDGHDGKGDGKVRS